MTEKEAVDKSIELWEWLARTGASHKRDWSGFDGWGVPRHECYLCEYTIGDYGNIRCSRCPYFKMYGDCCDESPYIAWEESHNEEECKQHASEFLAQLREVRANL